MSLKCSWTAWYSDLLQRLHMQRPMWELSMWNQGVSLGLLHLQQLCQRAIARAQKSCKLSGCYLPPGRGGGKLTQAPHVSTSSMATAKSLQQHWQSSCHRKVMHVDELEDGEIAGSEHETSLMPAPTDAARAQDTAPEEDEQEFELKKRKPKKEKKCKTLAWLQEPVDGATAVPLLKQKQQGASYYNVYGPDVSLAWNAGNS